MSNTIQSNFRVQFARGGNFTTQPLALDSGSDLTYVNGNVTNSQNTIYNIVPGPSVSASVPLTSLAPLDTVAIWNLSFVDQLAVTWQFQIPAGTTWTVPTTPVTATAYYANLEVVSNCTNGQTLLLNAANGNTYTFVGVSGAPATSFQFTVSGTLGTTVANFAAAVNAITSTTGIKIVSTLYGSVYSLMCSNVLSVGTSTWVLGGTNAFFNQTISGTSTNVFNCGDILGPRQCLVIPGGLLAGSNTLGSIVTSTPITLTGLTTNNFQAQVALIAG